jgi:hypothetical protein
MKQLITLCLLALGLTSGFTQTKNSYDNFVIPNSTFETWHTVQVNASLSYEDIGLNIADNWLATLNSLAAVPQVAGGPGPVTVFKSTDKHAGTYAAKAVSANFPLGIVNVFIPGMVGTAVMDNANVTAILGKPCPDCKPSRFKGFYKFEPVNGDSCLFVIMVSHWNSTLHKRDTIGYGKMVQHTAVNEYTQFDIPVNYTGTATVDSMTLLAISSAGFNTTNFMLCKGQVGSTMYLDDLTLDYPSGMQQVLMPEVAVSVYPNPASSVLHVDLSKEVNNGTVEVYNSTGKLVKTVSVSQRNNIISVSDLLNGSYYFRLMAGSDLVNTGNFLIQK